MSRFSAGFWLVALAIGLGAVYFGGAAAAAAAGPYEPGSVGNDVSYPQCGKTLPKAAFGIVGVTNGLPWSANPCLAAEYKWAKGLKAPPAFYTNTANPGPISKYWNRPGPGQCLNPASYADVGCSYNYGWNAAADAFSVASKASSAAVAAASWWWLDVETMNSWNGTTAANTATVDGYADYFLSRGVPGVGIYSTGYQWQQITGGAKFAGLPNWLAGASQKTARSYCGASFSGGPVLLVQYISKGLDYNYAC